MDELKLKVFVLGQLSNNCYLLYGNGSKEGILIDCPHPTSEIKSFLSENGIRILFIALTHGHFDHIGGLCDFDCLFYIHKDDEPALFDPFLNGSAMFVNPFSVESGGIFYENNLDFSGRIIKVIHTPGHTPGSVSLLIESFLFSGDTLFCRGVGRTDIPRASASELEKSVSKLLTLPDELAVYPGHGSFTTIGQEKGHNSFF